MNTDKGFTITPIDPPYAVTLFPNSSFFEPTPGKAIGVEKCNTYGGERLIVRYDTVPRRKISGAQTPWPGDVVYVAPRDVDGWKRQYEGFPL